MKTEITQMEEIIRGLSADRPLSCEKSPMRNSEFYPAKVACQGVECSYSHQACRRVFHNPSITFLQNFEDVFEAVSAGSSDYGVVPIENTLAGSVTDNYDLMQRYGLFIVGTVTVKISHCLLGVAGATVDSLDEVYSHEQALHQCSDFFREQKQISSKQYSNTAAAAKFISEQNNPLLAAIGSIDCAEKYNLKVLAQNLANRKDNFTRFVVISRKAISHPACTRISLVIRVAHRAGALYGALSRFANEGVNLLKLESRPIADSPFEFLFYWDLAGNMADDAVIKAILNLHQDTESIKFLGNYPEISADLY